LINRLGELARDRIDILVSNEAHDQRKADRTRAVLRVVKVQLLEDEGLAHLQNISDGGMMLRLKLPIYRGDIVTVSLADDKSVAAKVVWTKGERCGVEFTHAIDSAALLVEMAEGTRNGSLRAVRLPTDVSGVAYSEGGIHLIRVKDVSQHGMKVQHQSGFVEGVAIKIALASGLERRGVVRWSKGGVAGIQFLESVSLDELGSLKRL